LKLLNFVVILTGAVFQAKGRISISPGIARKPDSGTAAQSSPDLTLPALLG